MSATLKVEENVPKNPLLSKNLTSLALYGLWPFQSEEFLSNKSLRSIQYALGLFVYIIFFLFLITEFVELYYVWGSLEDVTTNMSVTCLYTIGVLKIYALFGQREKVKSLVNRVSVIERNILKYQNDPVKNILYDYIKESRSITYFYFTLVFCTISVFFIVPPIEYRYSSNYHKIYENGTEYWSYVRPMIFSSWFPFDKYAPTNYLIAYIYHMMMGWVGASYQAIWDMFVVSLMRHSIGQLRILRRTIEDITKDKDVLAEESRLKMISKSNNTIKTYDRDEIIHRRFLDCVFHHRYIIKFTNDLNDLIGPVMILYFLVCSIMLCAIGFQATLFGLSIRLGFMVEYLLTMMIQLFLFYYHGNEVILQNEKLLLATYSCDWYKANKRFKTNLQILREGIKLPINFTVGQFYIISLPTFIGILRGSYSYYALLRQVQEEI